MSNVSEVGVSEGYTKNWHFATPPSDKEGKRDTVLYLQPIMGELYQLVMRPLLEKYPGNAAFGEAFNRWGHWEPTTRLFVECLANWEKVTKDDGKKEWREKDAGMCGKIKLPGGKPVHSIGKRPAHSQVIRFWDWSSEGPGAAEYDDALRNSPEIEKFLAANQHLNIGRPCIMQCNFTIYNALSAAMRNPDVRDPDKTIWKVELGPKQGDKKRQATITPCTNFDPPSGDVNGTKIPMPVACIKTLRGLLEEYDPAQDNQYNYSVAFTKKDGPAEVVARLKGRNQIQCSKCGQPFNESSMTIVNPEHGVICGQGCANEKTVNETVSISPDDLENDVFSDIAPDMSTLTELDKELLSL